MAWFASHCGIIGAHPKQSRFQLPLQLCAKCLLISRLTISILGVLRRHGIPLARDPHNRTGVNRRSDNKSGSKVGHPDLAQSNTNLQLTQDRQMQGTVKNLTFLAGYVRCAITRKACVNRVHRFGFEIHLPMQSQGLRGGGQLGTTNVQSSLNHFTRQPQSVMWHLQYALHNVSRQGTMQCQETC